MNLIYFAAEAAGLYALSFVLFWISAMHTVEEADRTRQENADELSIQLRKQAIARRAGLQFAMIPMVY